MIEVLDVREATPDEIEKQEKERQERPEWKEAMLNKFLGGSRR